VQFHFTPTSASWLNQVEVWFSILQRQSLSGASFTSLKQLQDHIDAYVNAYNDNAETLFAWAKWEGEAMSDDLTPLATKGSFTLFLSGKGEMIK
jgi:DDE superfamily endonuclease